jgi:hypothetical protein
MKGLLVLTLACTCAAAGAAQPAAQTIGAQYKAAMAECRKMEDRKQRKECEAEAKGHRDVARMEAKSHPERGDWLKVDRARQQATGSTSDAQYAAEKEHCKQLSGDAKDNCIADAKKKFSKG